nr:reverse transcriptase domain-containing protein [Tanacetum cinerariifolium]
MSDSDESGVTHTEVSSPFEDISDIGSPRADDHEHLELPGILEEPYVEVTLQAPPSLDYIPSPEEPEQAPPLSDHVSGPEHADDEIVAEDQSYAEDASPTAQSPEYVPKSDLEAYPEEDDYEDPEEDLVDYPADGGDDGDDKEGSSEDDDMDIEADEEEEEEHPAPADSVVVALPADSVVVALPAANQASSAEETEPFETAPPPSLIRSLGYRATMIRLRVEAASTSHSLPLPPPFILSPTRSDAPSSGIPPPLPISAPTSSPSLQLPSASRREDSPEVTLPPRMRLGIVLGPKYKVRESSSATAARPAGGLRADYGFVSTIDREIRHDPKREREFETRVRRDTDEIYSRLDDEQSERQLLAGRINMLFRDRRAHEIEARLSREAWVRSMDASDLTHEMLRADHRRFAEIRGLRTADRTRQQQLIHILTVIQSLQRQVTPLQGHVTILQGQKKMAPKRTTRSTTDQETTNTTSVTNAQLQAMIDQGITAALAARDALRSTNGDDSHNSRTGVKRTERVTFEIATELMDKKIYTFAERETASKRKFENTSRSTQNQQQQPNKRQNTGRHEMLSGVRMAMIAIIPEQVLEGQNELLVNVLTPNFLSVNHYLSKAPKELPVFPNGVKEWSPSFISATALLKIKSFLMIRTFAERKTASKRKFENTSRNTQNQQQHSNKRQNTGRVYTATSGEKKQYGGSKPICAKCNYHHDGACAPKCRNCNRIGHFACDCRSAANTNNANNQRGTGLGQKPTCYECGVQGNFKRECPKLKNNNNQGNQVRRNNAPARVYAVGRAGTDPDANVVTGTFLLNNRYAFIVFDTGADRSFVSTTFSTQINITPSTLDHCYDVELADGRIIGLNTILRGCTLNLLNHPFNIDLMPVELGSFDAIIGMDWLAKYQAVKTACHECGVQGHFRRECPKLKNNNNHGN